MNQQDKQPESGGFAPVGTWVLLCVVALALAAGWLFLYFGVFLPRGAIQ
jgi:hypothetical protein